jgi:hypothetical protein
MFVSMKLARDVEAGRVERSAPFARACVIGLLLLTTGCISRPENRTVVVPIRPSAGIDAAIRDPETCTKAGGWWTSVGRDAQQACIIQASDAGKVCDDDSECEAFCAAPTGTPAGSVVRGTCSSGLVSACAEALVRSSRAEASCIE